ncbi:MAG: sugar/nucleoside kinase (ribokinase family) [Alphaproteobacteria bacterium]|jgi:sugar/nucleoside kinase (ribokinase family)
MDALFIGHNYTDVTFLTDYLPTGDEKHVGQDYAFGVGGNAVVAAFTVAKLGLDAGLLTQVAEDRLGDHFLQRAARRGIRIFPRAVDRSSLSLILPNSGNKRAIVRCRDLEYSGPIPKIRLKNVQAIHVDGHMPISALEYVKKGREKGILTSLDGGTVRPGMAEILEYIDIAVVSEDYANDMKLSHEQTLAYLHEKGVKIAAVTVGDKGLLYSEGHGIKTLPALDIPMDKIIDTTGAGDVFHGAYVYSYIENPERSWEDHFKFARCASALCIQKMGAETGIPILSDVEELYEKTK